MSTREKSAASFPPAYNSPIVQAGPLGPKLRLFHGQAGIGLETWLLYQTPSSHFMENAGATTWFPVYYNVFPYRNVH